MGDSTPAGRRGAASPVVAIDDVADADRLDAPTSFPLGSEVHDLDALLVQYLLDMDVCVPSQRPLRVLVVDGDETNRRMLREMLDAAGLLVVSAATADAAFRAVHEASFDVVVIDDRLRDVAGREVRETLRHTIPALPVLVMTDDPRVVTTWSAADLGAVGYVEKPVRGLLLLAAIRDAARARGG